MARRPLLSGREPLRRPILDCGDAQREATSLDSAGDQSLRRDDRQ